jgi:hypothetical protein
MKPKIVVALIVIAGTVGLAGCKQKETTVSGEVFIVTRGAENVKLGLVEVQLIPKQQVSAFLKMKTTAIEAEISSHQKEIETANGDVDRASANLNTFETVGPLTKPEYNAPKREYSSLLQEYSQLIDDYNLQLKRINSINTGDAIKDYLKTLSIEPSVDTNVNEITSKMTNVIVRARLLKIQLDKIETSANSDKANLEQKLTEAQLRLDKAKAKVNDYPTAENYFAGFVVPVVQKKLTDADGKFSFTYPRDSVLTFFAKAERVVGAKTEKYFWLVNAPTNSGTAQVLLSNQNLVYVDPDDYLKIKPVEASQE